MAPQQAGSQGRGLLVVALVACVLVLLGQQWRGLTGCPEVTIRSTSFAPADAAHPPAHSSAPQLPTKATVPAPALAVAVATEPAVAPGRSVLQPFNWDDLVDWRLATWDRHWKDSRVQAYDMTDLEDVCDVGNGLIFCTRIQIINRRLYVKDVRALELDRDYAVSRIAPFIDLIKFDPQIPDVEIFLALNDQPSIAYSYRGKVGREKDQFRPPPMFGATLHPRRADIPWPDYSFWLPTKPHKTRTPPWDIIRQQVLAAGAKLPWAERSDLAFFAGDTRHPVRKEMLEVVKKPANSPLFAIRTVWIHRAVKTCADAPELDDGGSGIREPGCRYAPPDYCKYKYILNLGSGGSYANKFKYSLLCKSLVIHVSRGNANLEFWQTQLVPGLHYLQVENASMVPALLRKLRSDPEAEAHARRIGI
ncbi:glycosyl transferase family 90-domain-containing protein [Pavlovales sp. CCMP2436]|nr:glycosyl transferase family 90-domain-containing protein [Pavlovales sp. CCMP2436]